MLSFKEILPQFSYIIEEMRSGVCFFEGYILSAESKKIESGIRTFIAPHYGADFRFSVWSNDTTSEDWEKTYSVDEYIAFFKSGKISWLHLNYDVTLNGIKFQLKIIFEPYEADHLNINIICYRDAILEHAKPVFAIETALNEFSRLFDLFEGQALFISSDNLGYPKSEVDYPEHWIKLI